jgi:hypothetical protein
MVKEDRLVKRIEQRANRFKLRALKGPYDEKRHDRIRRDEQNAMWIAYHQHGWSYTKIASVFDRDPRTVKQAVEQKEESPSLGATKAEFWAPGFNKHFDGLAEVAKTLCDIRQFVLTYEEDETFTVKENTGIPGFFTFQPPPLKHTIPPSFAGSSVSVDCPEVEYFFRHLLQRFPNLGLKAWQELITSIRPLPQEVIDEIRYLGNTAKFTYCSNCQVCKDLMAERPDYAAMTIPDLTANPR